MEHSLIIEVNISPINSKRTPIPYYIDVLHTKLSFDNGVAQQQDISHRYKWKQCHCNEEYQSRQ